LQKQITIAADQATWAVVAVVVVVVVVVVVGITLSGHLCVLMLYSFCVLYTTTITIYNNTTVA
jgi:hypothetical protein